jgi:hypothetical protein
MRCQGRANIARLLTMADPDAADRGALRKVNDVVLQLARIIARHMAREDFATRIPAAKANRRSPAARSGPARPRRRAAGARYVIRRSDRTGQHSAPCRSRPSAWHLGFVDVAGSCAGRTPAPSPGRHAGRGQLWRCRAITRVALRARCWSEDQHCNVRHARFVYERRKRPPGSGSGISRRTSPAFRSACPALHPLASPCGRE